MRKKSIWLTAILASISIGTYSQDSEWEPQKQITGYIATQAEYIDNLKFSERDYGISISEAGLLINYMPLKNTDSKISVSVSSSLCNRPDD